MLLFCRMYRSPLRMTGTDLPVYYIDLQALHVMEIDLSFTLFLNPLPDNNFRLVQIETNYRQHLKVHLK